MTRRLGPLEADLRRAHRRRVVVVLLLLTGGAVGLLGVGLAIQAMARGFP